ncbi:hypothetical protein GOODEAATRI_034082 [Goodea atripinnis]|uniref:Uncharacterized protein n=1 Tax=Goodea atripinnis TaxID=208336 RepID=A0ABV0PTU5_9TELE
MERSQRGGELSEGCSNLTVVPYKPRVEICKSQEPLKLPAISWSRPLCHCLGLLGISSVFACFKNETQKRHGGDAELTFFGFNKELVFVKPLENCSDVLVMLFYVLGKNLNVIQINENEEVEEIAKNIINESLKNSGAVLRRVFTRCRQAGRQADR